MNWTVFFIGVGIALVGGAICQFFFPDIAIWVIFLGLGIMLATIIEVILNSIKP
jgi:hypothetical protein